MIIHDDNDSNLIDYERLTDNQATLSPRQRIEQIEQELVKENQFIAYRDFAEVVAIIIAATYYPLSQNLPELDDFKARLEIQLGQAEYFIYEPLYRSVFRKLLSDFHKRSPEYGFKQPNPVITDIIYKRLKVLVNASSRLHKVELNYQHWHEFKELFNKINLRAYGLPQGLALIECAELAVEDLQRSYNKLCVQGHISQFNREIDNHNIDPVVNLVDNVNRLAMVSIKDWSERFSMANLIQDTLAYLHEEAKRPPFQFNIPELDRLLNNGFRRGEMMILGAPAGNGKTAVIINMIFNYLSQTENPDYVVFFSLEVAYHDIMVRLLKLYLWKKTRKHWSDEEITNAITNRNGGLDNNKIHAWYHFSQFFQEPWLDKLILVEDQRFESVNDIDQIEKIIKQFNHKYHGKIAFIAVDYIQFIKQEVKGSLNSLGARHEMLAEISNRFIKMKKNLKQRFILLSSMNSVEYSVQNMPTIDHIKDCKQIGYDADIVLTMLKVNHEDFAQDASLVMKVVKARNSQNDITAVMRFIGKSFALGAFNNSKYISDYKRSYGKQGLDFDPLWPLDKKMFEVAHKLERQDQEQMQSTQGYQGYNQGYNQYR